MCGAGRGRMGVQSASRAVSWASRSGAAACAGQRAARRGRGRREAVEGMASRSGARQRRTDTGDRVPPARHEAASASWRPERWKRTYPQTIFGVPEMEVPSPMRWEVTAVSDVLKNIETEDVYEPPLLVEAGEYAEATQGSIGRFP
ncbi:lasso RiPP family leader peptide-containing protein, partial [Streptomyces albicerus]|uniref:lasso RiPP family leader peptide-containing protein n=1 Tax=Streptomyces albicerus TaxID=2569859 RepID=UPI00384F9AEC